MKNILLGIGNELKGDDGIGNLIAREFSRESMEDWLSVPCETVPENFTSIVKKEKPELLVLVDAADMGIKPGEFRIIPTGRLNSGVLGTHGIPLKHLVSYLEEYAGKVVFIGIQPGKIQLGSHISPEVVKGKDRLVKILKSGDLSSIIWINYSS
jgi:hydrogenase 3 maturation protease